MQCGCEGSFAAMYGSRSNIQLQIVIDNWCRFYHISQTRHLRHCSRPHSVYMTQRAGSLVARQWHISLLFALWAMIYITVDANSGYDLLTEVRPYNKLSIINLPGSNLVSRPMDWIINRVSTLNGETRDGLLQGWVFQALPFEIINWCSSIS